MIAASANNWDQANIEYVGASLAVIRHDLQAHLDAESSTSAHGERDELDERASQMLDDMSQLPQLEILVTAFGLSPFEREILLACAGVELDSRFAELCASAHVGRQDVYVTFRLMFDALPNPHLSAMSPRAPLRRWKLIDVGPGPSISSSPLRIDERILNALVGVGGLDERLSGLVRNQPLPEELVASHHNLADRLARFFSHDIEPRLPRLAQLCGGNSADKRAVASVACDILGLSLSVIRGEALPTNPTDIDNLTRIWQREAILTGAALLVDCDEIDATEPAREHAIFQFVEGLHDVVFITRLERRRLPEGRETITLDVEKPTAVEQRSLWHAQLDSLSSRLNGQVDELVSQFDLNGPTIQAVWAEARESVAALAQTSSSSQEMGTALWDAARNRARPNLDQIAQRIDPAASWDDLVLPEQQTGILRQLAVLVRQRYRVYQTWGFASKSQRGLGISALFAGLSGTGKTMAAEVLALELRLDLYRIDLSAVVSKYIGETEKNLRKVFDAAESGGAILLFDEADALFGKRSEVKDSHDRHANIEISYLLQRMEAYKGLAVLTTNMKEALDTAFLRRIQFIVQFPFPDAAQRADIWRSIFPKQTPTHDLDYTRLAQLNVSGGVIKNIAMLSAFLAADAGDSVGMPHLLSAAQSEYYKLERPLTESETRGWI